MSLEPPVALIAELTHRCPLRCPYCSNPLELQKAGAELGTDAWRRVFDEAAALGVLQLSLTGGEPTVRRDLPELVAHARAAGLYMNLITSGVLLDAAVLDRLAEAGLDHVQLSFQDAEPGSADEIAGFAGHERKLRIAEAVRVAGLALTVNFVVHRRNLANLPAMIELGIASGAGRIEVAHVQYHGWAKENLAALLPGRAAVDRATVLVEDARRRLQGRPVIDYVLPDYHATRPKACMGGWAKRMLLITPGGRALPCHAAESLPGMAYPSVHQHSLAWIWAESSAFRRFRGTDWMREPCRSCERREIDFGGCRCQALALAGDAAATDPVCSLSPDHARIEAALATSAAEPAPFRYRGVAT